MLERLSSGLGVAPTCAELCGSGLRHALLRCGPPRSLGVGALAAAFSSTAMSFFFCTACLRIQLMHLGANVLWSLRSVVQLLRVLPGRFRH